MDVVVGGLAAVMAAVAVVLTLKPRTNTDAKRLPRQLLVSIAELFAVAMAPSLPAPAPGHR